MTNDANGFDDGDTQPLLVRVTGTCHTEGCGNAGHAITLDVPQGSPWVCGVCGESITDLSQAS